MNKKLVLWSITVGLGGLLFGMDVANISGAEQSIQQLWKLDNLMQGFAVAMALYGTIVGAAFGGWPADKFGRKKTLLCVGILFLIASIGSAFATDVYTFMAFRFIGGLSIGTSSVVAPIYISEIAPPQHRGRMGISFQLNIVIGILLAYVCNYFLGSTGGDNSWRFMLGIVAIPSLLFSIMMIFTPESPRWLLLHKHDEAHAREVLAITEPDVDTAVKTILVSDESYNNGIKERLFSKKFIRPLMLAFLIAFFNQMSGINAIIYYAPRVFEMTGLGKQSALLSSSGIGVVNLIFTMLGWVMIDKFGRRFLMFIGSFGYIISLSLVAYAFYTQHYANVPIYVFAFIAAHAVGQGAVIWVFISEIFPNAVRAKGMAWGSLTHWVFAALVANVFPYFAEKLGGAPIFTFFAVMMVFQLLYVWKMMPETRNTSLEDLQKQLVLH